MKLENHIEQRLAELFKVIKLLHTSIAEEGEIDMKNALFIKAKFKENPQLTPEEVSQELVEIWKAGRRYHWKTQQILQYIPIAIELKTIAEVFKLALNISDEDRAFFDNLSSKIHNIYTVEKEELVIAAEDIKNALEGEMQKSIENPENLKRMFNQVILRPEVKNK